MTARPPIAVLVKRFPKLSETFILSELLALEALGWPITIFTLAPPTDSVVHPDVAKVRAKVVQLDLRDPVRHLADQVRHRDIAHIHAHFAGEPAGIARKAAGRAGIGYSISAHAKDIYLTEPAQLRENLTAAKFVATCTSHNAQHLRKAAPGVPVAKLYHGIDCEHLGHGSCAEPADLPMILSVGRLRTKKGLDVLIDACGLLRDRGSAFSCEIVGYGPEEVNLRRQIDRLGLQDRIVITGKLGHEAVLERMRAASVFALPCRIDPDGDRDGIPNVILEAMATGLPVVSTPVSGVPEIVTHGVTGWLVAPEDPIALADCLGGLLDRGADDQIVANARTAVRSRFGEGRDIAMLDRLLIGAIRQDDPGIGYVIKGFPRLSESFISAEVLRLERLGKRLAIFALAHGDDLAEPVLADLGSPLAYMPNAGSVRRMSLWQWLRHISANYAAIHWRLIRRRPKAWLATLWQAVQFARAYRHRSERCAKRSYFKQFVQAGAIAEAMPRAGITHLHGHFCHNATTITWFAARLAGCSFSFTAHAKDIYQERHNPGDLLQRKIAAASFVTTCTAANHTHLEERLGPTPSLHTVYHGLDTGKFVPSQSAAQPVPRLIAVGRHVEKKGFDLLLAALRQLSERGLLYHCRLIGEPGPATAMLEAKIDAYGLAGRVRLDPPEPHDQLRKSYAEADIFVLPCRIDDSGDRDGIPNVLAEAMASGLAVISTPISGIPEIVRDGENGLLVPPDDVSALAAAIERLLGDPALRSRLGEAANATIRDVFDADRTILAMDRLFDTALARAA
jgi:glycosyltransferase involved in cell wall biosynthesis